MLYVLVLLRFVRPDSDPRNAGTSRRIDKGFEEWRGVKQDKMRSTSESAPLGISFGGNGIVTNDNVEVVVLSTKNSGLFFLRIGAGVRGPQGE